MRMRKKKNGATRIEACSDLLIRDTASLAADAQYAFSVKRALHLEIGCGKGNFSCGMSIANPNFNFIAMEKVPDVACLALEKAKKSEEKRNDNLRFLIGDAKNLSDWLPENCIDCIYLNFSDPWPKSGHAKRRLTHKNFLELYKRILCDGGILKLKTDNLGLFEFSLESFENFGLELVWQTRNLHMSEQNGNNIMTEYETNFSAKGMPIYSAWVKFKKNEDTKNA